MFLCGNRNVSIALAVLLVISPVAVADEFGSRMNAREIQPRDVRLMPNGALEISIVDNQGRPTSNQAVRILFERRTVAMARSDQNGRVTVSALRPGVHLLETNGRKTACRFWTADTAPPHAIGTPALVVDQTVTRGQAPPGMMPPVLLATGVAATALVVVLVGKNSASSNQPVPASP